ncbi:MAG: hypothetical protein ACK42Z_01540 [Candidatus Kapaibacteriota bacterium]
MKFSFIFLLIALLFSCQGGVTPNDGDRESFVSGLIIVTSGKSSWPKEDSCKELRVLVVPEYPPYNILADILVGRAYLSDTLSRFIDTIPFLVKIQRTPMPKAFILASIRYGTILQQRMIGFYKKNPNSKIPDSIFINKGVRLNDLNIYVDFNNLPEQQPID